VGRAGELALLQAAAAAARRGQPKVVFIEGEAGIGKSSLLRRLTQELDSASVLRASGDEAESLLSYGVIAQLVAGARGISDGPPGLLASDPGDEVDPLAVGAELVTWLSQLSRGQEITLALIDDLQWADRASARALLFAVRRPQADPVLVMVTARPGGLSRLGEGWQRFLTGDYRASQIRLAGLEQRDVIALGRALGVGDLPPRAVGRLLSHTNGNPLYCRAVLEELRSEGLGQLSGALPVPRSLAAMVLTRVGALSPPAQDLVVAAAVLGHRCELTAAAALAGLSDPLRPLGEAATAGILIEQPGEAATGIGFVHRLVQWAVYEGVSPARRRLLHERAAGLVDRHRALRHRLAAALGPDDELAGELEVASQDARRHGRTAQAAAWLAQAAAVSSRPEAAQRRLQDALEIQVSDGELAEAEVLAARVMTARPTARRSMLLGRLDFLAGRTAAAETGLLEAWQAHDRAPEGSVGAAAALQLAVLCLNAGRIWEGITWAERAAASFAPAATRRQAQGLLAIALFADGRGPEGLAQLAFLPAAPSDVPQDDTGALVLRGMAKVLAEDLAGAIADLSAAAARLRAGVRLPTASGCLRYLAAAEWRLGSWDDAVIHAELAVSLARDADRASELAYVHAFAAVIPAFRGDWEVASGHVRMAAHAAQNTGLPGAIIAAATARASLAMARGDLDGVIGAAEAVRATGRPESHNLGRYDWRPLEVNALIAMGRLGRAEKALAELEAGLPSAAPPSAMVTAARLRGELAIASAAGCSNSEGGNTPEARAQASYRRLSGPCRTGKCPARRPVPHSSPSAPR
jgi:hypothetical protein